MKGIIPSDGGPLVSHLTYRRQWLGERRALAQHHLASFREGHIAGVPFHVDSFDEVTMLMADIADSPGVFRICRNRAEVEAAGDRGEIALLLAPGHGAVGERPDRLFTYKALGAVMFPMSLNTRNLLADGCGERGAAGLSHLGVTVVKMLNRLGVIADVSHLSDQAFWDTVETSTCPVMASHSNSRVLCDNPRNLTDEQVKALARTGGAVGASVHPSLIGKGKVSIDDYVAHIVHFVQVAGEDHVMMGADLIDYQIEFILPKLKPSAAAGIYHGGHVTVTGLSGFADLSQVPDRLRRHGLSEAAVEKITRGNFLRLIESVCSEGG